MDCFETANQPFRRSTIFFRSLQFTDEIKVILPEDLSPAHYLLFTFVHVALSASHEASDSVRGYSVGCRSHSLMSPNFGNEADILCLQNTIMLWVSVAFDSLKWTIML